MTKEQPSLVTIVVRRIIFYSALAMLGQFLAVVIQAWSDDLQLGHMAIEQESFALAQGLSRVDGGVSYSLPRSLQARYKQGNTTTLPVSAIKAVLFYSPTAIVNAPSGFFRSISIPPIFG